MMLPYSIQLSVTDLQLIHSQNGREQPISSVARLGVYCLDEQVIHIQQSVEEIYKLQIFTRQ